MGGVVMKPFIPKQHGAWAMLVIPFVLGAMAGGWSWVHIPLGLGWLFLYLASYPLLMISKKRNKNRGKWVKWGMLYLLIALMMVVIVLYHDWKFIFFGLFILPFFLINMYFARQNNDRALMNDFSAIISFCIGSLASYYVKGGWPEELAWVIFMASVLFFVGSTFYVKTMIREKNNEIYRFVSWTFHIVVVVGWMIFGEEIIALAFFPSLVRAIWMYGKKLSILKIGILEIVNSVIFFIIMVIYIALFV
jgi:hypothetical protein